MRYKYVIVLLVISVLIVLPGGIARAFGASIHVLAPLAAFQLFALLAFFFTSLVSLGFSVSALIQKKWMKAGVYGGAAALPIATWVLAALTNDPGWQAVMGI